MSEISIARMVFLGTVVFVFGAIAGAGIEGKPFSRFGRWIASLFQRIKLRLSISRISLPVQDIVRDVLTLPEPRLRLHELDGLVKSRAISGSEYRLLYKTFQRRRLYDLARWDRAKVQDHLQKGRLSLPQEGEGWGDGI